MVKTKKNPSFHKQLQRALQNGQVKPPKVPQKLRYCKTPNARELTKLKL